MTRANIDDMTVGIAELSRICSMSQRIARDYIRSGVFVQRPKGRFPLIRCVSAYVDQIRATASGRDAAKDPSRIALASAQAAVAMAKAGVLSGKLVDVAEIEADRVAEWRKLRGLMLAIPTRVGNLAVGLSPATMDLIENEVRDVLTEMAYAAYESPVSLDPSSVSGVGGSEAHAPPAAKAPAKRVDRRKHPVAKRRKRAAR